MAFASQNPDFWPTIFGTTHFLRGWIWHNLFIQWKVCYITLVKSVRRFKNFFGVYQALSEERKAGVKLPLAVDNHFVTPMSEWQTWINIHVSA